jgi:hypothetical protein
MTETAKYTHLRIERSCFLDEVVETERQRLAPVRAGRIRKPKNSAAKNSETGKKSSAVRLVAVKGNENEPSQVSLRFRSSGATYTAAPRSSDESEHSLRWIKFAWPSCKRVAM